jgi:transcriptional regulator with XRE-family HTH domain
MVGIDRSTLIRLESGQVSDEHMSTDTLVKIAKVCGKDKNFCCDGFHSFLIDSAEQVIAFRKKYNLRQHELADLMGVAPTTVKRWENGRSKMGKNNFLRFTELLNTQSMPLDEYQEFISAGPAMIIRQFRKEQGLSQYEFAQKLGFARAAVQMWEQNRNKPSRESFEVLSKVFKGKIPL